jgi:hypothetical protein
MRRVLLVALLIGCVSTTLALDAAAKTGGFGALVPTLEARVDGPYAYLNEGSYPSSDPGRGEGGVALTFNQSVRAK